MPRTERCREGKIGEGGERQREGEKEMKTKRSQSQVVKRGQRLGWKAKKKKIEAILRQAGGGEDLGKPTFSSDNSSVVLV